MVDLLTWRARIGIHAFGGGSNIAVTSKENNGSDIHLAIFMASLLVLVCSIHPNPGPGAIGRFSFYICKYKTLEPSGMNKKPGSMGDLYEKVSGRI